VRSALKLAGLYSRARRNADKIVVRHNIVACERLPPAFDDYTILHISDLHFDISEGAMQHLVSLVGDLQYDICVLTGDYRGKTNGPFEKSLQGLSRLRAELREPILRGAWQARQHSDVTGNGSDGDPDAFQRVRDPRPRR
jgi:predicted MPP superfamily phosphohydrolase